MLLAGYARGDGCCPSGGFFKPVATGTTVGSGAVTCSIQLEAADCDTSGQSGFIEGGTCVAGVCVAGGIGTMGSDPVLTGFDNVTLEFFGNAGANYSVVTSSEFTVNMCLVEAGPLHIRHQEGEGTFVGSLAVLLPSLELIMHASEAGNLTFTLNGIEMDIASPAANNTFSYNPYTQGMGQVITILHNPFRFTIIAVKQFTDDISGYNRGHLDLSVDLTGPVVSPITGALGQTLYASKADDAFFVILSLTYHKANSEETISTSRRMLALEGHLQFPTHARLAARYPMGAHAHA